MLSLLPVLINIILPNAQGRGGGCGGEGGAVEGKGELWRGRGSCVGGRGSALLFQSFHVTLDVTDQTLK